MKRSSILVLIAGCALALGVVLVGFKLAGSYFDKRDVETRVVSKERVCDNGSHGRQSCKYLVFTDAGTFKVVDALFGTVRFNSSDVYGHIREDHCYRLRVYGWRFGPMSMYPNIANVTDIECAS